MLKEKQNNDHKSWPRKSRLKTEVLYAYKDDLMHTYNRTDIKRNNNVENVRVLHTFSCFN